MHCHNAPSTDALVCEIVGVSSWAEYIRARVRAVAACRSNVLVTGPTGTGKEVIARAIHAHSERAAGPFVAVDCAATTDGLFASHIFGHVKGAFTGADAAAPGCFRAADGGTIFLDEIGDLACDLQAKLLRVVQRRAVVPVGSHQEVPVDVRVIAATNRDLKHEVARGRFREDLYYRLHVMSLVTLALRDRPEDIERLSGHFLAKLALEQALPPKHLSAAALDRLREYDWPGNVRQLENVLERACFWSEGEIIEAHHVSTDDVGTAARPGDVHSTSASPPSPLRLEPDSVGEPRRSPVVGDPWLSLAGAEREHIRRTLEHTGGNRTLAARLLGVERHQLARKVEKYGLDAFPARPGRPLKRAA